ncbi:MAG: hypothetical protein P9X24_15485 [Candidatus Hatepunaea meridiana]|nr:hypothetical protein [Candidatus Hatepunaea meridiana]
MTGKNNILILLLIVILIPICYSVEVTADTTSVNRNSRLSEIIVNLATNEKYDRALSLIDSITYMQPKNPYCRLLKATVLSARAMDFEDEIDFPDILQACQKTEQLVRSNSDNFDLSSDLLFYLGMTELYRSIIRQRLGSWFKALKHILRGGEYLEEAIKLDSTNWDIHYGIGMYKYYRSQRAGLLRSIGIIADRRDEGINHIQIAAERGSLTRISARNSLAWIAYEKGNYNEAIRRSRELLKEYPGIRAFNWCRIKALMKSEKWEESMPVLRSLLKSVRNEKRNNHYNEIDCLHKLAEASYALEKWDDVVEMVDIATKIQLSEIVAKRKRSDIKHMKEFRKLAGEKIGSLDKNK